MKQKLLFLDEMWPKDEGPDVTERIRFELDEGWEVAQISAVAYGKNSTPGCFVLLERSTS